MKKLPYLIPVCIVFMFLLHSCSGVGPTDTSLVSITVDSTGAKASLQARPTTAWSRLDRYFAGIFQAPSASAAIPSSVSDVRVTVSAADMATLTRTVSVAGLPDVTITIVVPNGANRTFLVEGLSSSGVVVFSGQTTADLTGSPVSLTVTMTIVPIVNPADTLPPVFAGLNAASILTISSAQLQWNAATDNVSPAANIVYLIYQTTTPGGEVYAAPTYTSPAGATSFTVSNLTPGTPYYFVVRARDEAGNINTNTVEQSFVYPGLYVNAATGSDANLCTGGAPCLTIQRALTVSAGNEGIFVSAGTYTISSTLQLDTGTKLACIGTNHSSIISSTVTGGSMISGNQGALIDGCKIIDAPSSTSPMITDNASDMAVNNCILQGNGTFSTTGIALAGNSTVSASVITGYVYNASPGYGVTVSGGSPIISNNTFTANYTGIIVIGSTPTITSNTITNNTVGVEITSTATATVSGNSISYNTLYGIWLPFGASAPAASITSNSIDHNGTGINIQAGSPSIHGNNIFCNTYADLSTNVASLDATNNAWDHDPPSTQVPSCFGGIDICLGGTVISVPNNPVVSGSCP